MMGWYFIISWVSCCSGTHRGVTSRSENEPHKLQSAGVLLLANGESSPLGAISDNCNSEQMPDDPLLVYVIIFLLRKSFYLLVNIIERLTLKCEITVLLKGRRAS